MSDTETIAFYRSSQLATHPDAHPVALDMWLVGSFGPEAAWTWEPETLWREISLLAGRMPSEAVRNKIQAIRTAHVQNTPYTEWEIFEKVIQALDGTIPRFDIMQPPSIPTLMASMDALWRIRAKKLSDEVKRYCVAVFLNSGVLYAPPPLDSINVLLTGATPLAGQMADEVKHKMRSDLILQDNDPVDVQAAKLRAANEYMDTQRKTMLEQLAVLRMEVKSGGTQIGTDR